MINFKKEDFMFMIKEPASEIMTYNETLQEYEPKYILYELQNGFEIKSPIKIFDNKVYMDYQPIQETTEE